MIRHTSQIFKTPIPKHTAEQILHMLESMKNTNNTYYLDVEGVVRFIPQENVDILRQSMATIIPQKGKGYNIAVFDNPLIVSFLNHSNAP